MSESTQAAVAGAVVFLILLALMLLAAVAMASPSAVPAAELDPVSTPDPQITHLIVQVRLTLARMEAYDSGSCWEGAASQTSSLDLPWVWEEYPEWRLASSCTALSPQWPAGTNPVCSDSAGGPNPVVGIAIIP